MARQLTLTALVAAAVLPIGAQASYMTEQAQDINQAAPEQAMAVSTDQPVEAFHLDADSHAMAKARLALLADGERRTAFSDQAQAESLRHARAATR
ncbi:hypothetical protein [Halomonas sp. YLGW01]|uniref:hypothetical protein n=1 Tax=Halomonas sp. YLGW01 TaxID=2773308 RepID=UPI001786036E|nr:hypothetical protein [Halomonas sp. YLGW01]